MQITIWHLHRGSVEKGGEPFRIEKAMQQRIKWIRIVIIWTAGYITLIRCNTILCRGGAAKKWKRSQIQEKLKSLAGWKGVKNPETRYAIIIRVFSLSVRVISEFLRQLFAMELVWFIGKALQWTLISWCACVWWWSPCTTDMGKAKYWRSHSGLDDTIDY